MGMRLWHQGLIPLLPRQQLLGQHRECCALRGKGWGKKHSVVDYVFRQPFEKLVAYHLLVMKEMVRRGYKPDPCWENVCYRGKAIGCDEGISVEQIGGFMDSDPIYLEHNKGYYSECLENLRRKGINL